MAESSVVNTEWSGTGLGKLSSGYGYLMTPWSGTGLGKPSSGYGYLMAPGSGTDLEKPSSDNDYLTVPFHSHLSFRWDVLENTGTLIASGQEDFLAFARWAVGLQKLERQNRDRLAAVYMNSTARQLLDALDRKTSIKWENLLDEVEGEYPDILRSVVLLAGANLCDASPNRLRLSEYGDKLLAESSAAEQASSEVEYQPVR